MVQIHYFDCNISVEEIYLLAKILMFWKITLKRSVEATMSFIGVWCSTFSWAV